MQAKAFRESTRRPDSCGGEEHKAAVECRAASHLCTCTSVQTGHTEVEALAACSQPHEFRQLPGASRHKNARVSATCKGSEAGVDTRTVQYFARREGKRCASHTSLILTRGMVTAKHTTCVPRATKQLQSLTRHVEFSLLATVPNGNRTPTRDRVLEGATVRSEQCGTPTLSG